jgi:hypothetical protein
MNKAIGALQKELNELKRKGISQEDKTVGDELRKMANSFIKVDKRLDNVCF